MTASWLLIRKSSHGKLPGIPAVRWAVSLALTLVVLLILRVLVTAARSRLKARSSLTEPRLNDSLLQLLERTWMLSLLAGAAFAALDFVELSAAEGAGGFSVAVHLVERVRAEPDPLCALVLARVAVQASRHVVRVQGRHPEAGLLDLGLHAATQAASRSASACVVGQVWPSARRPGRRRRPRSASWEWNGVVKKITC